MKHTDRKEYINSEKSEYIAEIAWHYDTPDMRHTKKISIDAYDPYDVMDKVHQIYPNVQIFSIVEKKTDSAP